MRVEKDFIGSKEMNEDALFGIHSMRAVENFPSKSRFSLEWYKAIGIVKWSCYLTYKKYSAAIKAKYGERNSFKMISEDKIDVLIASAIEVSDGKYFESFIVPAIQGGAGTSINMNVNEIIANASLIKLGFKPGQYEIIDPIEEANVFQSTNDVIPTALKVCLMRLLDELELSINRLRNEFEKKESQYRNVLRLGYTQMQAAVPSSYGQLFSAYNESLSRDWWRVSKCFERIKLVNIGGGAIGTGISIPRYFIVEVAQQLQQLTGLPLARGENMPDVTSNMDSFVEIHGIMKSLAVNLEKMASDIRLLASDIRQTSDFKIPARQVGSSIMPGKVNPVIVEFVVTSSHQVYANDHIVTSLSAQGCLELNAYLPSIGNAAIDSLHLLSSACKSFAENLVADIEIHADKSEDLLFNSPAITTALIPYIGYHKSSEISKYMQANSCDVFQANGALKILDFEELKQILSTDKLLQTGYKMDDIIENNKLK